MINTRMIPRSRNGLLTLAVAIGATALAACTTEVANGGGGGPSTTSAGGGQSTSGAGGGVDCSSFLDPHGTTIQLHIVNHRATPVQYSTSCAYWGSVIDAAGNERSIHASPNIGSCAQDIENGGAIYGDCMTYDFVQIAPGETRDAAWAGVVHGSVSMPAACLNFKGDNVTCDQAATLEAGPMTFAITLTEVDTSETIKATQAFVYGTDTSITLDVN